VLLSVAQGEMPADESRQQPECQDSRFSTMSGGSDRCRTVKRMK